MTEQQTEQRAEEVVARCLRLLRERGPGAVISCAFVVEALRGAEPDSVKKRWWQ